MLQPGSSTWIDWIFLIGPRYLGSTTEVAEPRQTRSSQPTIIHPERRGTRCGKDQKSWRSKRLARPSGSRPDGTLAEASAPVRLSTACSASKSPPPAASLTNILRQRRHGFSNKLISMDVSTKDFRSVCSIDWIVSYSRLPYSACRTQFCSRVGHRTKATLCLAIIVPSCDAGRGKNCKHARGIVVFHVFVRILSFRRIASVLPARQLCIDCVHCVIIDCARWKRTAERRQLCVEHVPFIT
jgi:hypothetical protein